MGWTPTPTLQTALSGIFSQAADEAVRNRDLAVRAKQLELSQRGGTGMGGAAPILIEEASVACVREFGRNAPAGLLEMMREAYGEVPAEALSGFARPCRRASGRLRRVWAAA
jgi:hypothetical protein